MAYVGSVERAIVAGISALGRLRDVHVLYVVSSGFDRCELVRLFGPARKLGGEPKGATLPLRIRGQAFNVIREFEGFWRGRTGDLLEEVRLTLIAFVEGVTEDTNEEVSLVVVCARARATRDVENILEG